MVRIFDGGDPKALPPRGDEVKPAFELGGALPNNVRGHPQLLALCAMARLHQMAADPAALAPQLGFTSDDPIDVPLILRATKLLGLKAQHAVTNLHLSNSQTEILHGQAEASTVRELIAKLEATLPIERQCARLQQTIAAQRESENTSAHTLLKPVKPCANAKLKRTSSAARHHKNKAKPFSEKNSPPSKRL